MPEQFIDHGYPEAPLDQILRTDCILRKDIAWEQLDTVSDLLSQVHPYMLVYGEGQPQKIGGTSNGMLAKYANPCGDHVVRALFPAHLVGDWQAVVALHSPFTVQRPDHAPIRVTNVTDYNRMRDIAVAQVDHLLAEQFADQCPSLYTGEILPNQEIYVVSNRWDGANFRPVIVCARACAMPETGFRKKPMDPEIVAHYGMLEVEEFLTLPGARENPVVKEGYSGSVIVIKNETVGKWEVVGLLHGAPQGAQERANTPLIYTKAHQMLVNFDPTIEQSRQR